VTEPPRVVRIDEVPLAGTDPPWRPVRQTLGIRAFGVNAYTAPAGELVIEEHDELGEGAAGHEELYAVMRGHARFRVDGEVIDAPAGTLVFVPDPSSRRVAHAVADDTAVLVVGGSPGEAYVPSPWEQSGFAAFLAGRGDRERALALVRDVLEGHGDNPNVLYDVACAEALAGERAAALEHLRRAVELRPQAAEWAADDSDLDAIRDDPAFPRADNRTED
jgi:tetratricopeptide (TPR) repeat protein